MTIRRLKTYAGSQGYVYQYYFVGQRPTESGATEYVFDITSDRKTTYAVAVILPLNVVTAWNHVHGRALTAAEQYAAVKLRLFLAFDELPNVGLQAGPLRIDDQFLEESLATLGVA